MHPTRALRPAIIATLMAGLGLPASGRDVPSDVLRRQCADCHTGGGSEGSVDLEALLAALDRGRPAVGTADHRQWEAVWRNVLAGTMPPGDAPRNGDALRPRAPGAAARDRSPRHVLHVSEPAAGEVLRARVAHRKE